MAGPEYGASLDDVLAHHGIKGMHWGVRRTNPSASAPSSDDHTRAAAIRSQRKTSGTKTLSNKELQDLITRLNLERQVKQLAPTPKESVSNFIAGLLRDKGKQHVNKLADDAATKLVAGALKK